jgi:hypothetical protein
MKGDGNTDVHKEMRKTQIFKVFLSKRISSKAVKFSALHFSFVLSYGKYCTG